MIRLNLSREPSWLDLGHDVRVRVAPLTTSLMAAARSDPAVAALPEGASNEAIAVTMAKALARLVEVGALPRTAIPARSATHSV